MIAAQATQAGLIGAAFTKHRNHRAMTTVSNAFPAVSLTLSQIESHACNKDSPVLPSWHCLATLDFAYDKKNVQPKSDHVFQTTGSDDILKVL